MIGPHRLPCETPIACPADRRVPANLRFVLPATILGSSLGFIDSSVVNVALPAIQQGLGASFATTQWVVNGYMLTLAGLILLGGSAADRFGRRRVFLIGLVGFTLASLGCALASDALWLVIARAIQGAAAAFVTPSSLAIIGAAYQGQARGPAIGTWAAAGALTTALGPPLGGWLVDAVGWRAIFLINLPVGALAIALALGLPDDTPDSDEPLDVRGSVLATSALGLMSYGLIAMGAGALAVGVATFSLAVIVLWLFLRLERRSTAPMMPPALFSNRTFAGANVLTVLLYAALSGSLFLLPFMLIETAGFSAAAAGAAFLPFAIIMGVGSRWSGGLVERFGARLPLTLGPAITAAGFALMGISAGAGAYWVAVFPGLVIVSIGMTVAVAPLTTTVFDSAPADRSGTASGINNVAARAGGMMAVAALGLILGDASATLPPGELMTAYRIAMLAAAALAAASAWVGAVSVRAQAGRPAPAS